MKTTWMCWKVRSKPNLIYTIRYFTGIAKKGNSLFKSKDNGKGKSKEIVEDADEMEVDKEEISPKKDIQTVSHRLQKSIKSVL